MNASNVLIIADEPDFAKNLMARWHAERAEPAFTLMSSDLWNGSNEAQYEVAIVGPVRSGRLTPILKSLDTPLRPTICVMDDAAQFRNIREQHPRVLVLRNIEGWLDAAVAIITEAIRRVDAQARVRKAAERQPESAQCSAWEIHAGYAAQPEQCADFCPRERGTTNDAAGDSADPDQGPVGDDSLDVAAYARNIAALLITGDGDEFRRTAVSK